jgi:hypothetical protein
MMYAFFVGGVGITVRHWVERPNAAEESGARVEIQRLHEEPPADFSATWARSLGAPILRADLFTRLAGPPGNWEAAHYHPRFVEGWLPGPRAWDPALTADPAAWLQAKLGDLRGVLHESGTPDLAATIDQAEVDRALPHIMAVVVACMQPEATAASQREAVPT